MRSRNEEATQRKAFLVWGADTHVLSAVPEHQRYSKQNTRLADSIDTILLLHLHWQDGRINSSTRAVPAGSTREPWHPHLQIQVTTHFRSSSRPHYTLTTTTWGGAVFYIHFTVYWPGTARIQSDSTPNRTVDCRAAKSRRLACNQFSFVCNQFSVQLEISSPWLTDMDTPHPPSNFSSSSSPSPVHSTPKKETWTRLVLPMRLLARSNSSTKTQNVCPSFHPDSHPC